MKIIQGDCFEELVNIDNNSIDLIITDPPYGVIGNLFEWDDIKDLENFTKKWFELLYSKLKENGSIYIFWSQKFIDLGFKIFNPKRMLIWHHPNLAKPTNKMFLWTYDPIFYITKGKPIFNASFSKRENVDIFKYAIPQSNYKKDKRLHPTQKPLELIENLIKISSQEGDLVLDCFAGSGTIGVASKNLNRDFILIEKEKEYIDIINQRIFNI